MDDLRINIEGVGPALRVVRLTSEEVVSALSWIDVVVVPESAGEATRFVHEALGATATVEIWEGESRARQVRGVVTCVSSKPNEADDERSRLEVRVQPHLWLASKGRDSRVFQDMTVPKIVQEVLRGRGLEHELRLTGSYPIRSYCVQYQESDYDFVQRLMGEAGIVFFVRDPDVIVVTDGQGGFAPVPGEEPLLYRPQVGLLRGSNALTTLKVAGEFQANRATVKHYDPEMPHNDLTVVANDGEARVAVEVYDYRYECEPSLSEDDRAQRMLTQGRRGSLEVEGRTPHRRLAVGHLVEVREHPENELDGRYTLLGVRMVAEQPRLQQAESSERSFEVTFTAIPEAWVPRPPRPLRRVRQAVETAFVTGPPGEEVHVDEQGRIKVQFHWDRIGERDDRSSCWIRSMQPWSGPGFGTQFIPRVGMEVVVGFVGGDTDRPVVLGALYNQSTPVPFSLPRNKTQSGLRTRSTPGGEGANELMFEDAKDNEQIYLHAQRDLDVAVEHDHTRSVRGDERVRVEGDRHVSVGGDVVRTLGGNEVVSVERSRVVHIEGQQLIEVDGLRSDDGPGGSTVLDFVAPEMQPPPPDPSGSALAAKSKLGDAASLLHASHAPPKLQSFAHAMTAIAQEGERRFSELASKGTELQQLAATLQREDMVKHENLRAVHRLRLAAAQLENKLEAFVGAAVERREQVQGLLAPGLERTSEAVTQWLGVQEASAVHQGRRVRDAVEATCRAFGWPEPGDGPVLPVVGGGGATTGWKNVKEMNFFGKPDKSGMRAGKKVTGGSRTVIKGGGEIQSDDGFRIASKGCALELNDGCATLKGSYISLEGGDVDIIGGNITIYASTQKTHADVVYIQGGIVQVVGGPIRLN